MDLIFAIRDALRTLMLDLCSIIYKLITVCYDIFERIGTATLLENNTTFESISSKIGLILGLFMVFRITFSFVQYIINPDNMLDKNKGIPNIIKKVIISIILLGSVGGLFDLAYKVQDLLIESKVIQRVILGDEYAESDNFGNVLSETLFFSFFRLDDNEMYELDDEKNNNEANECIQLQDIMRNDVRDNNNYEIVFSCLNSRGYYIDHTTGETVEKYVYTFDGGGILALAIGVFALYSVCIFTIQVGIRLVQLAYLQIIAPIPIMMYITPKGDDYLKKWGKQCLTTFLDFFIRSAAIFFVVFVINALILEMKSSTSGLWTNNTLINTYILVILILALFHFAKKLPNLLKEILPSLGGAAGFGYGISFKKNVAEPFKSMYNTPLGWGVKTGGAIGKGIDRKAHGKDFFGDSAIRKRVDKWLPEQAEVRKQRMQAERDARDRENKYKLGEKAYSENSELTVDRFKNTEYKKSFENLKTAKKNVGTASSQLDLAKSNLNAAYAKDESTEEARRIKKLAIERATKTYDDAVKAEKDAQGALELAKARHDSNKKIYRDDAAFEDNFKFYKDTSATYVPIEDERLLPFEEQNTEAQTSKENNKKVDTRVYINDDMGEGNSHFDSSQNTGE